MVSAAAVVCPTGDNRGISTIEGANVVRLVVTHEASRRICNRAELEWGRKGVTLIRGLHIEVSQRCLRSAYAARERHMHHMVA